MALVFDKELERRITAFENGKEEGEDLAPKDWAWLLLLGIALPAVMLYWGWPS